MTNKKYSYAVLKYRHSYLLGEVLNIAVLLFLPEEKKLEFLYPDSLERLSRLYPDFSISHTQKFLYVFARESRELSQNKDTQWSDGPLQKIIQTYFLVEDASSLYFGSVQSGVYQEIDDVIGELYELYLSPYERV